MDTEDTIKWLKFACTYRMPKNLAAAAQHTARCHHKALTDASILQGMPAEALKQMLVQAANSLVHLSKIDVIYRDGDFTCPCCNHPNDEDNGRCPSTDHILSWVCGKCQHATPACE
jgi:hypothetical protein